MRATFVHLSGSRRGYRETVERWPAGIGTAAGSRIEFKPGESLVVSPRHAEVRLDDCAFLLSDLGSAHGTFVNDVRITEAILGNGDVIEVGAGGPRLRFLASPEEVARSMPFRALLSDSAARARERAGGGRGAVTGFAAALVRGVIREASWTVKGLALAAALLLLALLVGAPVVLYRSQRATEQAVGALAVRLESERLSRADLERRVAENRLQIERLRGGATDLVETLRLDRERQAARLRQVDEKLAALEAGAAAGERVIRRYRGGVALLQGAVGFEDETGRPLRYLGTDEEGRPLRDFAGRAPVSLEGTGPVVRSPFLGTGFLVSRDGAMLTTRHVVEPWRAETEMTGLLRLGVRPRVVQLRAFFPDRPEAVPVQLVRVAASADVALLRGNVGTRPPPVLPLADGTADAVAGAAVLVLGYPGGLDLILARVEPAVLQRLMTGEAQVDVGALLERLGQRGAIQPYVTWGHLADVRQHELTYDAPTTPGGSGGPILSLAGRVIGVNYATARVFEAASFGTPIRYGIALLAGGQPPAD